MTRKHNALNFAVAALFAASGATAPTLGLAQTQGADQAEIDRLFTELAKPDQQGWRQIEEQIAREWSKSGSPAMDLLLQRGRDALAEGEIDLALEHLGALTDHAPDFAEGWNAQATAYFQADRYGLALQGIQQTLAHEPRHFGAMIGLATILRQIGEPEAALEVLREVHAIHPHRPSVIEDLQELQAELEGDVL